MGDGTQFIPTRNGNGLLLKIIVCALSAGLVGSVGGMIKLYRDVGVLQSAVSLENRVAQNERLLYDINSDRDKRTVIIQNFRDDIAELKQRMRTLEDRFKR